ncbi:hypothetical protein F5Y10DRAFT_260197 [Nemania abortiva]|nr:hypothetical protein F5Y10DRAFT_260197 [Nemania abortiva]
MSSDTRISEDFSSLTVSSTPTLVHSQQSSEFEPEPQILKDLHVSDSMTRIHEMTPVGEFVAGELYQWVFSLTECNHFLDWEKRPDLLLVSSSPGRGKTMLLTEIARQLSISQPNNPDEYFLSYCFCEETGPELITTATVLKTLICTILRQQPTLSRHLDEFRELAKRRYFDDPSDFFALSEIFHSIVQDDNLVKTYLLVDAIDECHTDRNDPDLRDLMRLVTISMESPKIKWIISTRAAADIEYALTEYPNYFHLDLDSNHRYLLGSIIAEPHISSQVSKLAKEKGYAKGLEMDIVSMIQTRPKYNSVWVKIACAALQAADSRHILAILGEMPDDIELLYRRMETKISDLPDKEPIFCKEILDIMAIARHPLHISELATIVDLREGQVPVDTTAIVRKCSAFLEVRDEIVYFIDRSAKDYIRRSMMESTRASDAHAKMTMRLLNALSKSLNELSVRVIDPNFREAERDDNCVSIQYASVYWIWHMNRIEDIERRTEITESAVSFLTTFFPQWLHVLAEWRITTVVVLLFQLKGYLREIQTQLTSSNRLHILPVIQDAHRLLSFHQSLIGNCPKAFQSLSTFLYCPSNSLIKKAVIEKMFPWILTPPITENEWNHDFLALSGHGDWIWCIGFSPNGRYVVSGSHDWTVRIWDAQTGTIRHILRGHNGWISGLAISTKGLIASGSYDCLIKLWECDTGRPHRKELPKLPNVANAISFSPDGKRLIAAAGRVLYMWDLDTEVNEARELTGHGDFIRSVAFSHDGSLVASAGDDGIIHIWDTESWAMLRSMKVCDDTINSVVFSPTMRRIASGSDDRTIKIWNADTGELMKKISSEDFVRSLAFSPCGSRLAAAVGSCIEVLEVESGQVRMRRKLREHGSIVDAISFAPSGEFLASSSHDGVIRFWYDESDEFTQTDMINQEPQLGQEVNSLATTEDGSFIASCTSGTIQLWDGNTGQPLKKSMLKAYDTTVRSLTLSPDNQTLAFISNKTVNLYEITGGRLLRQLFRHDDGICSTVFAPDGRSIGLRSDDREILVWDLHDEDNAEPQVLEHHGRRVTCLAFSSDGVYLASGGTDAKVRLWARPSPSLPWVLKNVIDGPSVAISNLVFFPNLKRIFVALWDGTVEIWDIRNGKRILGRIKLGWTPRNLWFDPRSTEYVMTERGAQSLQSPSPGHPEPPAWAPYGILHDQDNGQYWITWKNKKVIFIPKKFWPCTSCVRGHKVVLGCQSGRTLLFNFSTEVTPL